MTARLSTGVPALDSMLGGGLLPGTLTVVAGATGIGKTQLGVQFAAVGAKQEGRRGVFFDMCARGDSQNHAPYAERIAEWSPAMAASPDDVSLKDFFAADRKHGEYLKAFEHHGRRVTKNDLDWEEWRLWQAQLNWRLRGAIAFLYGNFVQGCRRVVVDGFEPVGRAGESIQLNLFEYVYHQVLRKDPDWVARDMFRESFRENEPAVMKHLYDPSKIACMMLYTSPEVMLDDLLEKPIEEGDALSNANTIILMGKRRQGDRMGRALHIAKHRGSACDDRVVGYSIDDGGLKLEA